MRLKRRGAAAVLQPPMVPMISLMFNLLMFFILMPSNASEGYLTTNLPKTEGPVKGRTPEFVERIKISLVVLKEDPKGENIAIYLGENREPLGMNFELLQQKLIDLRTGGQVAGRPILIWPYMACQHRWVVKTFDTCLKAGFSNIEFAAPYDDNLEPQS
jgi:biopolymer transport protein ExbD